MKVFIWFLEDNPFTKMDHIPFLDIYFYKNIYLKRLFLWLKIIDKSKKKNRLFSLKSSFLPLL